MTPEDARILLAGPFGLELARFPLRFCKPAFFGIWPRAGEQLTVNNGTASLVARDNERFAITCHHVLEGYRTKRAESDRAFFQIGNCRFEPLEQVVGESETPDVAVIGLTAAQADEITDGSVGIGEAFAEIGDGEPVPVPEGAGIAFGGFPGDLRLRPRAAEFNFGSFGCGATPVTSSREHYLVCQFERVEWIRQGYEPEPTSIGGMSGGPAFRICESEAGIISHKFAGIVYEFNPAFELLYIAQLRAIHDLMG